MRESDIWFAFAIGACVGPLLLDVFNKWLKTAIFDEIERVSQSAWFLARVKRSSDDKPASA